MTSDLLALNLVDPSFQLDALKETDLQPQCTFSAWLHTAVASYCSNIVPQSFDTADYLMVAFGLIFLQLS